MLIRNLLNRKNYYLNIILLIFLLVSVITLSFAVIFSSIYSEAVYVQLANEYQNRIDSVSLEFDNLLKQIDQMDVLLHRNIDVDTYLFSAKSNQDDIYIANNAQNYTRTVRLMSPYLHSIYLYNSQREKPLFSGAMDIDMDQIIGSTAVHPDTDSNIHIVLTSITQNNVLKNNFIPALSIVIPSLKTTAKEINNAIIYNLKGDMIVKDILGSVDGITMVVDNSGRVLLSSFANMMEGSIKNETYFNQVINSTFGKGHFRCKIDDTDSILAFSKNYNYGFYIINICSMKDTTNLISKQRNKVLVIALLLLAVFLFTGYLLARYMYSPIRKISDSFANSKFGNSSEVNGDLSVITDVFTDTLKYVEKLEFQYSNKSNILKENTLRNLLVDSSETETEPLQNNDYGIQISYSNLILVCAKIDNYTSINEKRRFAYVSTLSRIIPDLLKDTFKCETVSLPDGEIAMFLNYNNPSSNSFTQLLKKLDHLREICHRTLNITVTFGIGGVVNHYKECRNAYRKGMEMVKYRFVLGNNRVIYNNYIEKNLISNLNYPDEIEEKLVNAIRLNKIQDFASGMDELIALLKNYHYSVSMHVFLQIVTTCMKTINQFIGQDNKIFHLHFNGFENLFSRIQTLDQAKPWLIDVFEDYSRLIIDINQRKNDNKHSASVEKIQEYIIQHYSDANLSIEFLADLAGYTSYYFSRIFKELTGTNISDLIRQVRIDKAKDLIVNTNYKMNVISKMTGFYSLTYFHSTFKKSVGLTPTAYREYRLSESGK